MPIPKLGNSDIKAVIGERMPLGFRRIVVIGLTPVLEEGGDRLFIYHASHSSTLWVSLWFLATI